MWTEADGHIRGFAERPRILVFAPHTRIAPHRSGIHRVAMRLIQHLPRHARVDLVRWDEIEGQLRYCDRADMRAYFDGAPPPDGIEVNPFAHRIDYRFSDTLSSGDRVIVLMPEVFHLGDNGNEIHARVIAQSIVNGWTTAAVFFDLIPLKGEGYPEREAHARCLAELARVDIVIPISRHAERDLRAYWGDTLGLDATTLSRNGQRITAVPLADRDHTTHAHCSSGEAPRDTILLLGTIEPRKQQIRVIRAFKKLRLAKRAGLRLALIGGINPRTEVEFRQLITGDPDITWLGRASDAVVDQAFATARFSVFASQEEGFGLPIVESLCRDVPCLTANTGAMREAAEGGGCLLVDIGTDAGIEAGLEHLALTDVTLEKLRGEIRRRSWRTWDDYARALVAVLDDQDNPRVRARATAKAVAADLLAEFRDFGDKARTRYTAIRVEATDNIALDILDGTHGPLRLPPDGATHVVVVAPDVDPAGLDQSDFDVIGHADAWFCFGRAAYEVVVARAAASGSSGLLSGCCGWSTDPEALVAMVETRLAALVERRIRCRTAAARDAMHRKACARLSSSGSDPLLTVVISTYNGAAFIERNVTHTLQLMRPLGGRVRLVVVDNASMDDTPQRLEPFISRGEIESIRMPCNTGLLGNLHAVSTLIKARHVWTIGVDDIIVPGALERIIDILQADPACPFIMPNFAVYHREGFEPNATCEELLADSRPVAQTCMPDGMTDVRHAASQHDNLLTAFYIIIFRSDLMAAVFNNPFTAPFFGTLVDTVPSTKVIFEAFPDFAAFWLEAPIIAGNAHNTWRYHRVAWHGILMPMAFELAREAGLNRHQLRQWAQQHIDLLEEAERLYPNPGVAKSFPEEALEPSFRVFGTRLFALAA